MARYRTEGEAAFEPRSRRPLTSPAALSDELVDLIVRLHKEPTERSTIPSEWARARSAYAASWSQG